MISNFIKVNIIIVLTVLSYLLALLFEYGYAKEFNFPFDMISIDIKTLFIATACVTLNILILLFLSHTLVLGLFRVRVLFVIIIIFLWLSKAYSLSWLEAYIGVKFVNIILCILTLATFVFFAYQQEKKSQEEPVFIPLKQFFIMIVNGGSGFFLFMLAVVIMLLISTSLSAGKIMAGYSSAFYTFEFKGDKYAIIKKYDSNLITAKVTDKKLAPVVTYFTTDSLNGLALSYEEGITREGASESKN